MPIRINLREVFASDSQTIAVDKINFNFNKLIELGIGDQGPIGDTGIQGPAGPVGPVGDTGQNGLTWYVGSANPNTVPPASPQDGDFYLNTSDSTIWQWDGSVWNQLIDFTAIIDDYLATTTQTLIRGFGDPQDNNFIVFPNRDEAGTTSTDLLFLSNFNEISTTIANLSSSSLLDGAILQLYVDSTAGGSAARAHLEFGAIYSDGVDTLISERDQNLKVKYYQHDNGDSTFTSVSSFNLSKLETSGLGLIDRHGIFEFITPNFAGAKSELSFYLGSQGGLSYITSESLNSSGLVITSSASSNWVEFGIADDLFSLDATYPYSNENSDFLNISGNDINYVYLRGGTNTAGVFIDSNLFQDSGDIIQVGTGDITQKNEITLNSTQSSVDYSKHIGMSMIGDRVYVVHGNPASTATVSTSTASAYDKYHALLATDPSNIKSWLAGQSLWSSSTYGSGTFLYGTCDIDMAGDYAVLVNNHTSLRTGGIKVPFAIAKLDEKQQGVMTLLYSLSTSSANNGAITSSNTTSNDNLGYAWTNLSAAYRVKVQGNIAYVINKYNDNSAFSGDSIEGTEAGAYLSAIDITNPYNPIIVNSVFSSGEKRSTDMTGTTYFYGGYRHLALDVNKSIAATLTWKRLTTGGSLPDYSHDEFGTSVVSGSTNQVILNLYDLSDKRTDPTSLYTETAEELPIIPSLNRFSAISISSGSSLLTDYGAVSVSSNHAFVSWTNTLYVHTIPTARLDTTTVTSVSSTTPAYTYTTTDTTYNAVDSKVSGRFLYVLWNNDTKILVTKHDIFKMVEVGGSSGIEPVSVYEYTDSATASRLLINGKYLYVSTSYSTGDPKAVAVKVLSTDGILSPAANIDSIQTSTLQVNEKINVGDSLKVGYSANVGSGGISTTGPLSARQINGNFHNFGVNNPTSNDVSSAGYHQYPLCNIPAYSSVVQSGIYEFSTISHSTEQRFWKISADGTATAVTAGTQNIRILWTRIGNIVNISGYVYNGGVFSSCNAIAFPAPLYTSEITNNGSAYKLYALGTSKATWIDSPSYTSYTDISGHLGGYPVSGTSPDPLSPSINCIDVVTGGPAAPVSNIPLLYASFYYDPGTGSADRDLSNVYFSGSYSLVNYD